MTPRDPLTGGTTVENWFLTAIDVPESGCSPLESGPVARTTTMTWPQLNQLASTFVVSCAAVLSQGSNWTPPVDPAPEPVVRFTAFDSALYRSTMTPVDRLKEHDDFLKAMAQGVISPATAQRARKVWYSLLNRSGHLLPIPAASAGPDGQVFYSWDKGRHHLEVEILPGEEIEYFYRDRETGEYWGDDVKAADHIPDRAANNLKLFV